MRVVPLCFAGRFLRRVLRRPAGARELVAVRDHALHVEELELVHGHRGARAMRPENTIPAFEYAISVGVDVLELDMAVTKDDVLVVSHDPLLNPEICQGPRAEIPIRTLTLTTACVREAKSTSSTS